MQVKSDTEENNYSTRFFPGYTAERYSASERTRYAFLLLGLAHCLCVHYYIVFVLIILLSESVLVYIHIILTYNM